VGKRARRSATNWDGTGISKRADLSRTSGFVPIFCTNDLISWKSFEVDKKLACFKSKIQFRRGVGSNQNVGKRKDTTLRVSTA